MEQTADMSVRELTLAEIDEKITQSTVTAANEIGYFLKQIRDRRLYKEAGSNDVYEYAQRRYGYATSTTSRLMAMNDKFSIGGNSPDLEDRYRIFSKSQLMEMLPMSEEQIQTVDPGMTVKKIKEIKVEQKAQEEDPEAIRRPTSKEKKLLAQAAEQIVEKCAEWLAEDEHTRVYSKKSHPVYLLFEYEINRRKTGVSYGAEDTEYVYGVYIHAQIPAPGSEFVEIKTGSTLIGRFKPEYLRREIEKAYSTWKLEKAKREQAEREKEEERQKQAAAVPASTPVVIKKNNPDPDSNPVPEEMENLLDPATITTAELPAEAEEHPKQQDESGKDERPDYRTDNELLKDMIIEKQQWVDELSEVYTPRDIAVRKYQLMIDALKSYQEAIKDPDQETKAETQRQWPPQKESAEEAEVRKRMQPPLPDFRNDKERKEWIQNFTDWGLWYSDGNIEAYYYRYDFEDGSWLVAEFHPCRETEWTEDVNNYCYYHLIHKKARHYKSGKLFEEKYMHQDTSVTYIVRFLKDLQKGKKENEQ